MLQSNSFQAAIVSGGSYTFVFFFYGDMEWGEFANIGFYPSFAMSEPGSQPFMIPIALSRDTVNIEDTSNVGLPGFYAFRVDGAIIQEPETCKTPRHTLAPPIYPCS